MTLNEDDFKRIEEIVRTVLMTAPTQGRAQTGGGAKSGVVVPFGKNKGMPIEDTETKDLEYIAGAQRTSLADPSKARWKQQNEAVLVACEAELAKRGHHVAQPYRTRQARAPETRQDAFEIPQPTDDDESVPF